MAVKLSNYKKKMLNLITNNVINTNKNLEKFQDSIAFVQTVPSSTWTIPHQFGIAEVFLNVFIYQSDGELHKVQPNTSFSNNLITLNFGSTLTTGRAMVFFMGEAFLEAPVVSPSPSAGSPTPSPTQSPTPTPTPTATPSGSFGTLTISGVNNETTASNITVPSGATTGDMLVLVVTNGTNALKAVPDSFTSIYADAYGAVGYTFYDGSTNTFPVADGSDFYALVSVNSTTNIVNVESSSLNGPITTGGDAPQIIATNPITPLNIKDLALMIFVNADEANVAPAPSFTNLFTYNQVGFGGCGMSISWGYPNTLSAFAGDTCGVDGINSEFPGAAIMVMLTPVPIEV